MLEEGHKLLFTAINDKHASGAAGKGKYIISFLNYAFKFLEDKQGDRSHDDRCQRTLGKVKII